MTALRIKICGITRAEDALLAAELGAWAVGFIFYTKSPRYIPPAMAAVIIAQLPAHVLAVGVFVNATPDELRQAAQSAGIGAVQLHGDEPPEVLDAARQDAAAGGPLQTLRAIRPQGAVDLQRLARHRPTLGYVVDAAVPGCYGGTGQRADWLAAQKVKQLGPIFLAGGLSPDSVAAALTAVRPDGIDVSSGVESRPGQKCPARLRALFQAARTAALPTVP